MATQMDSAFRAIAGETLYVYRLVKIWTDGDIYLQPVLATVVPCGTVQPTIDGNYAAGNVISVRDIKAGGTHKVVAAGTIADGAPIYAAADGRVSALPAVAGTYRCVGIALEAASGIGSIIEAWLTPEGATATVTGS